MKRFALKNVFRIVLISSVVLTVFGFFNPSPAMAAVAIVQSARYQPSSNGTSIIFTLGATPTPGNILVAFTSYSQYLVTRTISAPDGTWTQIDNQTLSNDSLATWWHSVSIGDGNTYTFTITNSAEWESGVIYEISGANSSAPINQHAMSTTASASAVATPSVIPSVIGTFPLAVVDTDSGATSGLALSSVSSGWIVDQSAIPSYHTTFGTHKSSTTVDTTTSISNTFNFNLASGNSVQTIILVSPPVGAVPGAPTIGTATAGNATSSVTFTPPSSSGSSTITSYTATSNPGSITATSTGSPITVSGLTNGTSYTFTVYATNSFGNSSSSAASNAVTPATVPSAPTGVSATRGNTQVALSWTAPSNGGSAITSYKIYQGTSSGGETLLVNTGNTSTTYTNTGLTNGTTYYYKISAVNSVGEGSQSSEVSATPATVPGAPTIGAATAGNTTASVTFTAPASNGGSAITSYTAVSSPGNWTGSGASSPVTVSGLTNGTSYTFTVYATNSVGNGVSSAASNAVTPLTNCPSSVATNVTISTSCAFPGTTDGVDAGITINSGSTLTIKAGQTIVFDIGSSFVINGSLVIIGNGQLVKSYLWALDADADGFPATTTVIAASTSPGAGYRRLNLLSSRTAADCNDSDATRWQTVYSAYQGGNICVGHYVADSSGNAIGQSANGNAGGCTALTYYTGANSNVTGPNAIPASWCPSQYVNATFYYTGYDCGNIASYSPQSVSGVGTTYASCSFTMNAPTQLCNGDSFYYSFSSSPAGAYTFITRTWNALAILNNYLEGNTNVTNKIANWSGQSDGSYTDSYCYRPTNSTSTICDCQTPNFAMTWASGGTSCTTGVGTGFYSSASLAKNPGVGGGTSYYSGTTFASNGYQSTLSSTGSCSTNYKTSSIVGSYSVSSVTPTCGSSDCYYQN